MQGAVYIGGGTFAAWDATFNGISPCMYISLICPVPFSIWKEFCRDVFPPVSAKRDNFYH